MADAAAGNELTAVMASRCKRQKLGAHVVSPPDSCGRVEHIEHFSVEALKRAEWAVQLPHDCGGKSLRGRSGQPLAETRTARLIGMGMRDQKPVHRRAGMTERDLAAAMARHYSTEGAKPVFGIVRASENGAYPHHSTGDRALREGGWLVVDFNGANGGHSSDLTRMDSLGKPTEGYAEIRAIVEEAVQAEVKAARPCVQGKQVDNAARSVIEKAGYGPFFVHRTGHGMGLEVHEPTWITAASETVLHEGMVFAVAPGVSLPGHFGVRLEDIVILRADGPEILSDRPRDLNAKEV
ncbi:M24 family metallopeptidase [Paracoccus jeotgali]|nr:M24 family metallopeptidase [Paracoccus jeotgali]